MSDPIADVIERIRSNRMVQAAGRDLRANFLNNVGQVFETYGFATTRQFLRAQRERGELRTQADAVLEALECMDGCEAIERNRAIGRLLIKTLNSLDFDRDKPDSWQPNRLRISRQGGQR